MKKQILFIPAICLSLLTGCSNTKEEADMIVFANQIYTANKNAQFADAIAIKNGKYIYVGDIEGASKYKGKSTAIYSTEFVMPSGIEGHAHFLLEQAFMKKCYIKPLNSAGDIKTKAEILAEIEDYALLNAILLDNQPHLFGYGYNQLYLPEYSRSDLDNLAGGIYAEVPIYIAETSLHEAWVNTITLTRAGVALKLESGAKDPVVGIQRDSDGFATGVLTNEAVGYILQKGFQYPICNDVEYRNVVKNTCEYLNSMGYTGHYDAWTNFDGTEGIYKALHNADVSKELTCLFTSTYNITTFEYGDGTKLDDILNKVNRIRSDYKSERFDPKYVKLFADGVLETGTGYMKEPYIGIYSDFGTGEQIWSQEDMNRIVLESNKKDLLVHTHTLGDASCTEAVQSFVNSNNVLGKKTRNSLGHCVLIDDPDVALIKENEIGLAMNAGWLAECEESFDLYEYIIGPERGAKLYPYDKLIPQGIKPAISTDRPCSDGPIDIFDYMASIVLGYDANEGNRTPRREMNVTVENAIDMLTINGAWMGNYEDSRGSIEVGKYADFVTSEYSPFNCNPRLIKDIEIQSTCFEGKFVYFKK